jgi:WD40 repeat protein
VARRSFGGPVQNEQISPDGRYTALDTGRSVSEVDAATLGRGRSVTMQAPPAGPLPYSGSIGISAGGVRVATGTDQGTGFVWDGVSGRLLVTLAPTPGTEGQPTVSVALNEDGRRVLVVGQTATSYTAAVWDVARGRRLSVLPLPGGRTPVANAVLSPNGSRVATTGLASGSHPAPGLLDAGTGRRLLTFPSKAGGGTASAIFSHDGRLLVTGGEDGVVRTWNLATGAPHQVAQLPDFSINDAEPSLDDRVVAVGSRDGQTRVFDAASGTLVAALAGPQAPVTQVQFSSALGPIVTLDHGYRLRFYACDVCGSTADVLRAAGRLVTRELTVAERREFLAGS